MIGQSPAGAKRTKLVYTAMLAAVLAFIWIHSAMPVSVSAAESEGVLAWIGPLLERILGEGKVTHHLVRKLAHLAEYSALGLLLYLNLRCRGHRGWRTMQQVGMLGLLIAFLDETIQIFSGRGPRISDVWLDLAGVAVGAVIAALVRHIIRRHMSG